MRCPSCNKETLPGMRLCLDCESKIHPVDISVADTMQGSKTKASVNFSNGALGETQPTICSNCGNQTQAGSRVCQSCGKEPLPVVDQPAASPTPQGSSDSMKWLNKALEGFKHYDAARYGSGTPDKMADGRSQLALYRSLPTKLTGLARAVDVLSHSVFVMAPHLEAQWKDMGGNTNLSEALAYLAAIEYLWFSINCLGIEIASLRKTHSESPSVLQSEGISVLPSELVHSVIKEVNETEMDHHLTWFTQAQVYYGDITKIAPSLDHISFDDNLVGKAATLIAYRLGEPENVHLTMTLTMEAGRLYNDLKIPMLAKDLAKLVP
jgi:hypothetical protein